MQPERVAQKIQQRLVGIPGIDRYRRSVELEFVGCHEGLLSVYFKSLRKTTPLGRSREIPSGTVYSLGSAATSLPKVRGPKVRDEIAGSALRGRLRRLRLRNAGFELQALRGGPAMRQGEAEDRAAGLARLGPD